MSRQTLSLECHVPVPFLPFLYPISPPLFSPSSSPFQLPSSSPSPSPPPLPPPLSSGCRLDSHEAALVLLPSNISVLAFDFAGCGMSQGDYVTLGKNEVIMRMPLMRMQLV